MLLTNVFHNVLVLMELHTMVVQVLEKLIVSSSCVSFGQ